MTQLLLPNLTNCAACFCLQRFVRAQWEEGLKADNDPMLSVVKINQVLVEDQLRDGQTLRLPGIAHHAVIGGEYNSVDIYTQSMIYLYLLWHQSSRVHALPMYMDATGGQVRNVVGSFTCR